MTTDSKGSQNNISKIPFLFVDDEPLAHKVIKKNLKDWNITSAFSGQEAMEILETNPIQLVVTDIGMPGMDGIELLQQIKKKNPIIQVIIVSGSEDIADLISTLEAGANDFLLKPLKKNELEDALLNTVSKIKRWKKTMKEIFINKRKN